MGLFSAFFNQQKGREFEFKPRYYNEIKERQKKRIAIVERERELEDQNHTQYQTNIRGAIRSKHESVAKIKHRSNVRFVLILAALIGLAYYLLYR